MIFSEDDIFRIGSNGTGEACAPFWPLIWPSSIHAGEWRCVGGGGLWELVRRSKQAQTRHLCKGILGRCEIFCVGIGWGKVPFTGPSPIDPRWCPARPLRSLWCPVKICQFLPSISTKTALVAGSFSGTEDLKLIFVMNLALGSISGSSLAIRALKWVVGRSTASIVKRPFSSAFSI